MAPSLDEKTQVQALDRTQPLLPIDFGTTEKRTHDYIRHGTTNLFAALDTGTGEVIGQSYPRRRVVEFLAFLDTVTARFPDRETHVVLDDLSTHSGDDAGTGSWNTRPPPFTSHRPAVPGSIRWKSGSTSSPARPSAAELSPPCGLLINTINACIENWDRDAKPFTWTPTPTDIITTAKILDRDFKKLLTITSSNGRFITRHWCHAEDFDLLYIAMVSGRVAQVVSMQSSC